MKKLICLILCLASVLLIGCGEKYEKSDAVFDLHKKSIEYLDNQSVLQQNKSRRYIVDDALVKTIFVESYVKLEHDGDFELYIRLKYDNDLETIDDWYYVQVLGGDFCEAKKTYSFLVTAATLIGYKHTDKVDKKWE